MNIYKGSFTIEAACIMPLILMCICIAIKSGITLHNEVKSLALQVNEENGVELSSYLYRKELIENLLGDWDED